eukprot:TRINITY_DN33562_c0_g1_i1.p2 TRINITY_DN33562_c0_g1~~TRINITY_DN33562_c0_g1_i1.p2  ORF type:complete len:149 (-),score=5.82 TRINITY_DN33562_c0_g1_i1:193-639(-)
MFDPVKEPLENFFPLVVAELQELEEGFAHILNGACEHISLPIVALLEVNIENADSAKKMASRLSEIAWLSNQGNRVKIYAYGEWKEVGKEVEAHAPFDGFLDKPIKMRRILEVFHQKSRPDYISQQRIYVFFWVMLQVGVTTIFEEKQ